MHNYQQGGGYGYNRHDNYGDEQGSHTKETGVIIEWAYGLGYWCGKVASDKTGQSIFVDSRDAGGIKLFKGDRISFNVTQGPRGQKANNVSKEPTHARAPQHSHEAYPPQNIRRNNGRNGVLYFQTGFYDKRQMEAIQKKFGRNYAKGPKMLFGDNYADRFRPNHTQRISFGGQSELMGHYDRSFGFGIPTTFDQGSGNQPFEGLITRLFNELAQHLRNGGDVIIPYPSKQDLKDRPQKYFKSKYMGLSKTEQLIKHNLGTGRASLSVDQLLIIQKNIDKLKDIARRDEIVNQALYNNNNYDQQPIQQRAHQQQNISKIGGVFFQTEWFTKEQLQHIVDKYNENNGPIMLFNDNDADKKRWRLSNRSDFGGMAKVMGKYDKSYSFGITTAFKGGSIPNLQSYQQIIDAEFKTITKHLNSGRDVVIPAPSAKDIQHNKYKYYRYGKQTIFHNLGEELPPSYSEYIQRKISELRRKARVSKNVDYYDFNAVPNYKREQRQQKQQQYGSPSNKSNSSWTCSRCYKPNTLDNDQCIDCLSPKSKNNDDDEKSSAAKGNKRRRRRRNSCSSDEESDDSQLDENELRKRWQIGSEVEIYSKKQQQWFKGKILNIWHDDEGEVLSVQYLDTVKDKTREKDVERYTYGEIRPIKKAKRNRKKVSDILEIDVDELGIEDAHELLQKFEEQNNELRQLRKDEQFKHEFALKEAELKHNVERNRLKTILKGKELKLREVENERTREEAERQKYKLQEEAERNRSQQEANMRRERERNQRKVSHLNDQIKNLESFVDESGVKLCWEFKEDNNEWKAFDNEQIIKQLNTLAVNHKGMIFMNGKEYEIKRTSKDSATQINLITGTSRDCRRRVVVEQQISWEWQENNGKWIQYSDTIAKSIEKLNQNDANNNKYSYTFAKNNQTYEITRQSKGFGVQINVGTNASRKVRRIISSDDGGNIYPHFWDLSKIKRYDQAEIVNIPLTQPEAKEVIKNFGKTAGNNITKLEAIMNQCMFDRYTHECDMMLRRKNGDKTKLNELELYHGTKKDPIVDVVKAQGFRKEFTTVAAYGEGTYFARDASYSVNYASTDPATGHKRMFVCKVLCGESVKGSGNMKLQLWPLTKNKKIVDSLSNNPSAPSIFVMHDDSRIYPMWIIYFQ